MKEDLGVLPMDAVEHDVLESLSNDEAIQARQVVAALKLSKQELQEHLLPEVGAGSRGGEGRGGEGGHPGVPPASDRCSA
jgi:hypothetical protein